MRKWCWLLIPLLVATAGAHPRYRSKVTVFTLKDHSTRTVYTADGIVEAPNWSRDGRFLLVNTGGRLYRLSVDAPNARLEPLALDAQYCCNNDHDFSPDGRQIAFSASSPASRASQVYVADADGANPRLLVAPSPSYSHGWSPDGRYVAFVGQRDGHYSLFRVPTAGGPEERLTSQPPYDDGPDYSRDGRWIYFNSNRSGGWDIWRMPAGGAGPHDEKAERVTSDEWEDWFPHPSPNGKMLLMFSFPKGTTGHNERLAGVQLRSDAHARPEAESGPSARVGDVFRRAGNRQREFLGARFQALRLRRFRAPAVGRTAARSASSR
jgi:Tol biopolymer transport system component